MATLPRTNKPTPSSANAFARRQSEFDAGINTSNAWTEHLERGSLSDEEPDADDHDHDDENRPARALYNFEGKPEFRELDVEAGEQIVVVKQDLADGWSLVKNTAGEVGLLPRSYYTVFAYSGVLPSYVRLHRLSREYSSSHLSSPLPPISKYLRPSRTGRQHLRVL
jgi:sorting nexin-9/18/33